MKIVNKTFELIGEDGMKHIILSSVLATVIKTILPWWVAGVITMAIGVGKEIYDYKTGKGHAQVKDIIADLIGVIIGVM